MEPVEPIYEIGDNIIIKFMNNTNVVITGRIMNIVMYHGCFSEKMRKYIYRVTDTYRKMPLNSPAIANTKKPVTRTSFRKGDVEWFVETSSMHQWSSKLTESLLDNLLLESL